MDVTEFKSANSAKQVAKLTNINDHAAYDRQVNNASRHIENIIMAIHTEFADLCHFAYELRKADSSSDSATDKYTYPLLDGNIQSSKLVKLILSNVWNQY